MSAASTSITSSFFKKCDHLKNQTNEPKRTRDDGGYPHQRCQQILPERCIDHKSEPHKKDGGRERERNEGPKQMS